MTQGINRQWRLAARTAGPVDDRLFRWVEEPIPAPAASGQILVRNLYFSIDPTQREWIAHDTYLPAVRIGDVMRSLAVARVVDSRHPGYARGDLVQGLFGWQDYALVDATVAGGGHQAPAGHADHAGAEHARAHRAHGVLRAARRRARRGGRDGGRLRGSRRDGLGRRADRQDQAMPRDRHRGRRREMRMAPPRGPLHRRHRLQVRGRPDPPPGAVPERHRRLLRQRGWSHPRRRPRGARLPGAGGALRRHLQLRRRGAPARAEELHEPHHPARQDGGLRYHRLCQALRRGCQRPERVGRGGADQGSCRCPGGAGERPEGASPALRGREPGQAALEDRRSLSSGIAGAGRARSEVVRAGEGSAVRRTRLSGSTACDMSSAIPDAGIAFAHAGSPRPQHELPPRWHRVRRHVASV
ncbi:uncharacterized protein SOCE26_050430 [Sorangium cellulosum]|uniref:Oxidoreductase N-terminal domain-containing protein n=1 Tax=Sorangium cellulosum TaxID=56 RepID=A0A2L0EWB5_SORCE|nr:uncharacterized protein SOCE26_050430 [Sorangium cellulosum]